MLISAEMVAVTELAPSDLRLPPPRPRLPPKDQLDFKSLHFPRKREGLSTVSQEAFRMRDLKMSLYAFNVYFIFNYTLQWL